MRSFPDFGNVQDNATAFHLAMHAIEHGNVAWGREVLVRLREHIRTMHDVKSVQCILPHVEAALQRFSCEEKDNHRETAMLIEQQRGLSDLRRTIVWGKVVLALLIVSLGLCDRAVAFTLNSALLPAADMGHDATSTAGAEPPSPQLLRVGIALVEGRVTVGAVISPAWEAAQRRDVHLSLAGQALTPEAHRLRTAQSESIQPRLSGVETLLLRPVHAPLPSAAHGPRTVESAPTVHLHRSAAQQLDQERLARQRPWGRSAPLAVVQHAMR